MGQNNKVLVLVVEDDLAVRSSLAFSLEIEGFKVRSYATGEELLDAGSFDGCDCFIIDQKLPGLSGLDLIAKLRDRHVDAPAILITSNPSAALCRQAEKASELRTARSSSTTKTRTLLFWPMQSPRPGKRRKQA